MNPHIWRIAAVVVLGPLMTSLDSTIVNVSLSALGRELRVPFTTIQWVTTAYLLALALILPLSGWLVDRIGAKHIYLISFVAFTVASLMCGMASSAGELITARILQGMAGGLLAPMSQMMVAQNAGRHIAKVMGLVVVPVLLGPICGPTLAGLILQHASWQWIFFINLPIGVLATVLAVWLLPKDELTTTRRSFDFLGFLLLSPGLVLLLYSLESLAANALPKPLNWLLIGISLGLMGFFVRHALRSKEKSLVDIRLFRNASFSASASTQFFANATTFGGQTLLPSYMMVVQGITPTQTGLLLAPAGLGMLISYPSMGFMTERFGARYVSATGAVIALLGTVPFAFASGPGLSLSVMAFALFVRGVGTGAVGIPSNAAAYSSLRREDIPVATTAINIVQRLGGPFATTALAVLLHAQRQGGHNAEAFRVTFWLLCAFHFAAVFSAARLPRWANSPKR